MTLAFPKPNCKKERAAKRRARSDNNSAFYLAVMEASGGKCENVFCLSILKRWRERLKPHHITYRSDGGPDTVENGIMLCPDCHTKAHHGNGLPMSDPNWVEGRKWMQGVLDYLKSERPDRFRWHEAHERLKKINESNRK